MPTYEYACQSCSHELQAEQRMADDPLVTCPECGKDTLERLVSQSSFALKGSGWYADGYGGAAGKKSADTASTPAKSESTSTASGGTPAASDTKKAESKPAAAGSSSSD